MRDHITIATRGSQLALWQANYIQSALKKLNPGLTISMAVIKTKGDVIQDVPLARIGGKGLFVKEIEEALLCGSADLAVHSIKDVPMQLAEGLQLACVPKRAVPFDCYLSMRYPTLKDLPKGARVGTSSLRRQAQLFALRPDLQVETLRGNIDTRLRKLKEGLFDAILLAQAGLTRLNLTAPFVQTLAPDVMLPAVGQGALGIECLAKAFDVRVLLAGLEDWQTRVCVQAERALLAGLDGGCQVPIGGYTRFVGEELELTGLVAEPDGSCVLKRTVHGAPKKAEELGQKLASDLLSAGGKEILQRLYQAES